MKQNSINTNPSLTGCLEGSTECSSNSGLRGGLSILLVDDDRQNSLFLKKFLEVEGYEVTYAENGQAGWEQFVNCSSAKDGHFLKNQASPFGMPSAHLKESSICKFDLVLLDVNMPVMNGFELARRIREVDTRVLIFFLTDRTEKTDRLRGFDLKGNDYIPKPFYPEELIARIKERTKQIDSDPPPFLLGHTLFNPNLATIEYAGRRQHLTVRQSDILLLLAQDLGSIVERDFILERVWGNASYANSLALNVQISYLRHLLAADNALAITSLKKRGYVLEVKTDGLKR